ncbi:DUF6518 family protein [Actinoplanes utahensis]|uniref:Permease n=1 Tax=Actinoplanes utahensis TaxID=1869 RepID=A0A0A6UWP1_ACTUT|nr:DUF6518 family protein [Actinoplanes utahensis]KHD78819.1 hypothetical protein MB27_01470 [Actinoplanes utahensis]GIF28250.1 hypothetical protein Aut01nite_12360 [Actinoplanes utahensis]
MTIKRNAAVVAPMAGFLLGFLDFVWIKYLPSPVGDLGNSLAVWAVAAFLLTYLHRWRLPAGIAAAIVCLVVAVPSYYLAAALIQNDDWSNLYNTVALAWMGFGVVAGVVFGGGGVLARTPGTLRLPALALPAAVLFAEGLVHLRRIGEPGYEAGEQGAYASLVFVLGLLITMLVARTRRDRLLTLAWSVPLTAGGWLLLTLASFR